MHSCKSGTMKKTEVSYPDLKLAVGLTRLIYRMLCHGWPTYATMVKSTILETKDPNARIVRKLCFTRPVFNLLNCTNPIAISLVFSKCRRLSEHFKSGDFS